MNNEIKNIDLNSLTPQIKLDLSGVKMGDDLEDTLKINLNRVNKNTNKYYTPTLIIFNYVRFVNDTQLKGVTDKNEYLETARDLLDELKSNGFEIGTQWRDNNKLPYSRGNKKLSKDTIIINLSPSSLCISKNLGLCEVCGFCYALSSERRYINTLIYRLTQLIRFEELSVEEIVNQLSRLRRVRWLRVNESGDIFNLKDVEKLQQIAKKLYEINGVITYIYTHRRDIWDKIMDYSDFYFRVNRSGVDFNPSPKVLPNHPTLFCDGDCNNCVYCKLDGITTPITSLYHGDLIGEDLRGLSTKLRDKLLKSISFKIFNDGLGDGYDIQFIITQSLRDEDEFWRFVEEYLSKNEINEIIEEI